MFLLLDITDYRRHNNNNNNGANHGPAVFLTWCDFNYSSTHRRFHQDTSVLWLHALKHGFPPVVDGCSGVLIQAAATRVQKQPTSISLLTCTWRLRLEVIMSLFLFYLTIQMLLILESNKRWKKTV